MDFLTELKLDNQLLKPYIDEVVDEAFTVNGEVVSEALEQDVEIMKSYLAKPGRGIGGSLLLRFSQLYDDELYSEEARRFAAATEIINAHLLIIDDWIDNSDTRKGQPSVHKSYAEYGDDHSAGAQAVQLGMLTLHVVTNELSRPELVSFQDVRRNIYQGAFRVSSANMLEPRLADGVVPQEEKSILALYEGKTGYYSFVTPIISGLLMAGAGEQEINDFTEVGMALGLAFQFQDDIMGTFGDPEVTGKPNVDDMREGLYTILVHRAKQLLPEVDYQKFSQLHGRRDASDDELRTYRHILLEGGVKSALEREAQDYLERAQGKLEEVWLNDWNGALKAYIDSLIDFLYNKKY